MSLNKTLLLTLALAAVACRKPPEDEDEDGSSALVDCDDANADVFPGASELCNGVDDDCSGDIDEDATDAGTFYADFDGDGFGASGVTQVACAAPDGFVAESTDCDDAAAEVNPDAKDDCTIDRDFNCDGGVGYADGDGDGFPACEECDDAEASINPGAVEVCNGEDDDCDGADDDDAIGMKTYYADTDDDGFGDPGATSDACAQPTGYVTNDNDCDDDALGVNPDAAEVCDKVDQNCNGVLDDNATNTKTYYLDADGDGQGGGVSTVACDLPSSHVANNTDCDDLDAKSYQGASESCDGADNDCNGAVPANEADGDVDGWMGCEGDCADTKANTNPAAPEVCDGADNDCDGTPDDSAVGLLTWYVDGDADGWGTGTAVTGCTMPSSGVSTLAGDCNDASKAVRPGATEFCDAADRDCDGDATADAVDADVFYTDADSDGYGDPGAEVWACTQPSGTVLDDTDCEDGDKNAYPGSRSTETPLDGVDTDCDGNDYCTDLNCDGMPDLVLPSHHDGDYVVTSQNALSGPSGLALGGNALSQFGTLGHEVLDLDKDGYLDLVYAEYHNGSTWNINSYIFWGSAAGYSDADRTSLPTHGVHRICTGDLNGDGWTEIVFANHHDGDYTVDSHIYWNANGTFTATNRTALPGLGATDCEVADFNNDGRRDVVLANYYNGTWAATNTSYVYFNSATGFTASNRVDLPSMGAYTVDTGDLNGDGRQDIVFWSHHDGDHQTDTYVYYNGPSGFSIGNRVLLNGWGPYQGSIADMNGDGRLDLLLPGYYNFGWGNMVPTYVYWNDGTSTPYANSRRLQLTSRGILSSTVNDIDLDGNPDIILLSHHDGDYQTTSMVFWGAPGGAYNDANRTDYFTYGGTHGADAADINHDGYKDLFIPGYHNNGWGNQAYSRIYWGNASGRPNPNAYSEVASRGAWTASIAGQ